MAKPIKFDESGDSDDLQSLFDSIAGSAKTPPPPPPAPSGGDASGDSDELQALFDNVSSQVAEEAPAAQSGGGGDGDSPDSLAFNRIGHLARQLHDSLRQLGYDQSLEDAARQIPDARERLTYIAKMTEQAATRVLTATEIAKPMQDQLLAISENLGGRWERMFANQLSVDEFKSLAGDTRTFFQLAPEKIRGTNAQLTEIVMAQDFQDLTGQVIKKVVDMVQTMETQLLQVLLEVMPEEKKAAAPEGLMNGPVISAAGRNDVVTTQQQVDDLLESLGF